MKQLTKEILDRDFFGAEILHREVLQSEIDRLNDEIDDLEWEKYDILTWGELKLECNDSFKSQCDGQCLGCNWSPANEWNYIED